MTREELETKYDSMVRNLNLLRNILHDAESAMIEEVSAEGFASAETRTKIKDIQAEVSDADFELYCFKQDNADFIAKLKAERAAAKAAEASEKFEKFWNN